VPQAQEWPQRPVRAIVPFAAGGNIDVMNNTEARRTRPLARCCWRSNAILKQCDTACGEAA
jgi:hypothetical protein